MATHSYISTTFWDDAWVQEIDPSEKLVYMYLMTNPLTSIIGVYKITDRRICFDTGFNADTIKNIMEKFTAVGKAVRFGEWVILPTWPKHQSLDKNDNLLKGFIRQLQELPEDVFEKLRETGYRFDLESISRRKEKEKKDTKKPEPPTGGSVDTGKPLGSPSQAPSSLLPPPTGGSEVVGNPSNYSILSNSIQSELNINSTVDSVDEDTLSSHFIRRWQQNADVFNCMARLKKPKDWQVFWEQNTMPLDQIDLAIDNFIEGVKTGAIERRFIPSSPDGFVLNGWITRSLSQFKKQGQRISNDNAVDDINKYFREA